MASDAHKLSNGSADSEIQSATPMLLEDTMAAMAPT
jgi:hypothetical protein